MSDVVSKKILLLMPMALVCALLSGVFLPIYSDEIMNKFNTARFFLESGQMLSFFPQCTTTVGHDVAWVFYPAAILISSVYAYLEPLGIRVSGVVLALTWFALLAYWCHRQSVEGWVGRFTLLTAFAALGVMPYLWVLSRPEQFMLLPILLFCMSALYAPTQRSKGQQLIIMGVLGLLLSIFFYAHPKSLFFTPFFLAATWIATRDFKLMIRAGLLLYVLVLSARVLLDASLLAGCQDAPAVQSMLAANSLMPGALLSDPLAFFGTAWQNISQFPQRMLLHLTFSPTFQSGWLPPLTESSGLLLWLNPLIHYTLLSLVVCSHLLAIGLAVIFLVLRRISVALFLAALLAAGDLINIALYNLQNFYSGIQYIPLSIVIAALLFQCLPAVRLWFPARVAGRLILSSVAGLSMVSLFTLFYLITPNLLRNADYATASIPGQPLSIPVLGVQAHLDSIRELGQSCHIPVDLAEHVVVDHMTYFAYLKDRSPMHVLYISEFGYGRDLLNGKLLPFLKERNSPGLITRCEWVPSEFRDAQRQNDRGYCCVDFGTR
ncbi:hypothetical protein [Pseudomonas sp. GM48]|uniref:hypothetical protein n=1 Tax=Pseudomonas sp. GM48 TaxID=1144330 RepID=UPI00027039CE|nr:hypothetical protein [Pseudomonas sp. GM48]EJM53438.1 hypothetical protein PMI28_04148 [Pseudomonas sp. GM48]